MSLSFNKQQKLREKNQLVIRLSTENRDIILNSYIKYFNSIYGEKYIAFQKLLDIRRLTYYKNERSYLNKSQEEVKFSKLCERSAVLDSTTSTELAIQLVYSLSLDGKNRKLALSDQLELLDYKFSKIEIPDYKDNYKKIHILFIIGFILGDGTLYLRLRN